MKPISLVKRGNFPWKQSLVARPSDWKHVMLSVEDVRTHAQKLDSLYKFWNGFVLIPPIQTIIERGYFVEFNPFVSIRNGRPMEFNISGNGEDYIGLSSSHLYYTVGSKIIRALEIGRVKKLIFNAILWNKYLSSHDL